MSKIKPNLEGVSETLLISLWSRAQVIERDTKAKDLVDRIDYDFSRFDKWKNHLKYTILRTNIFDMELSSFLKRHPDAVVVNIGAGLDTRYFRVDNGEILWYEFDLPAVIALRKQFFEETTRYRFIAASLNDDQWMPIIQAQHRPLLFIAEGVLMYLTKHEVEQFFKQTLENFSTAEMLVEVVGPIGLKFKHPLIRTTASNPGLQWGIWNTHTLEQWDDHIKILQVFRLSDSPLSFLTSLFFGNRVVHVQFR